MQDDGERLTGIRRTDQNRMIIVCIHEYRFFPESRHIDGETGTLCDRLTIYMPASYGIELMPVIDSEECQDGIIRQLRIVQDTVGFRQKGCFVQNPSYIFSGRLAFVCFVELYSSQTALRFMDRGEMCKILLIIIQLLLGAF